MPIRFRCVYCDKLLGIARRKAGTVIACPHCSEKLIVPVPEAHSENADDMSDVAASSEEAAETAEEKAAVPGLGQAELFENDDFDVEIVSPPAPPPTNRTPFSYQSPRFPDPPLPPAPIVMPRPSGLFISSAKLPLFVIFIVLLLAGAFLAGYFVNKMLKP